MQEENGKRISDAKGYHKNPRTITEEKLGRLRRGLEELGDLSGVIFDINSKELVGGNQRSKIFSLADAAILITERFDTPTKTGTVALGYVLYEEEKYAYREVDWTPEQCEQANLLANKAGGDFDNTMLTEAFDLNVLYDIGFSRDDLGLGREQKEFDRANVQGINYEAQYGVIVMCDSEEMQKRVYDKLQAMGYELKIVTT